MGRPVRFTFVGIDTKPLKGGNYFQQRGGITPKKLKELNALLKTSSNTDSDIIASARTMGFKESIIYRALAIRAEMATNPNRLVSHSDLEDIE